MHLAAVIFAETIEELQYQAELAVKRNATMLEFRIDALKEIDVKSLQKLFEKYDLPKILTYRSEWNRGKGSLSRDERNRLIFKLAHLPVQFIDFEYPLDMSMINKLPKNVRIVVSLFDFEGLAKINFDGIEKIIQDHPEVIIKIAATPSTISDLKVMWRWAHLLTKRRIDHIVIGLGSFGQITRFKSKELGNLWAYGRIDEVLGEPPSPGMLPISVLERGLAEDAIHIAQIGTRNFKFHSRFIRRVMKLKQKKVAVLEFPLEFETDLSGLLNWFKEGLFEILFVEDPWAEIVPFYLDKEDSSVSLSGRCNLVVLKDQSLVGYNTEWMAIDHLYSSYFRPSDSPSVYIEGINQVAKSAIAYFSIHSLNIVIRNRTFEKIEGYMTKYQNIERLGRSLIERYDILLNCVPFGTLGFPNITPVPLQILPHLKLVIDTVLSSSATPLEKEKKNYDYRYSYISGKEFFVLKLQILINIAFSFSIPKNEIDLKILFRDFP